MNKWKSWLAMTALSLSVIGCAPAADEARDTAYHGAGTGTAGVRNNMATDDNIGYRFGRNHAAPLATGNVNDQISPRTYTNNAIFKDGQTGRISAQRTLNGQRGYGYATYSKRDINAQQNGTYYVDYNVLARAISSMVSAVPGVEKSSVLVTDEDIFIGCPGVTDAETLNRAKLSAWAMSPRWYKIYISGDENTIDQVNTLVNRAGTRAIDHDQLEAVLKTRTFDMTGMNVTDNGQNITNYNMKQTYPNTNGTHRTTNQ